MTKEAIKVAKKQQQNVVTELVLSTGYTVRIKPVSQLTIEESQSQVKYPPVPIIYDVDKDREYPNPNDPTYKQECQAVDTRRGIVAVETALMLGVQVELPEDNSWLDKLREMHKRKLLDLSEFDFENDLDKEFLFKKHIAFGGQQDLTLLMTHVSGLGEEAIAEAMKRFRANSE